MQPGCQIECFELLERARTNLDITCCSAGKPERVRGDIWRNKGVVTAAFACITAAVGRWIGLGNSGDKGSPCAVSRSHAHRIKFKSSAGLFMFVWTRALRIKFKSLPTLFTFTADTGRRGIHGEAPR